MIGERTSGGWVVSLRPHGAGRFFLAAHLLFWLCGWAFAECFAIRLLGRTPLQTAPALAFGALLVLWLAVWTLIGIAGIRTLLELVWSEDRILVEGGGLTLERQRGPFRRRRGFPRDQIRRIAVGGRQDALALETPRGSVELSRFGTREEREAAAGALRTELGIPDAGPGQAGETLPEGWEDVITPEGDRAVVPAVAARMAQARVAGGFTLAIAAVAIALVRYSWSRLDQLPFAIMFVLGAVVSACGAVWLARGRMEWHIAATRFRLTTTHDRSDNQAWFTLDAVSDASGTWRKRRRITSMADPSVPRGLGTYLARAGGVPFEDRTTKGGRAGDFAALREKLEKSGPLGRFAVRFVMNAQGRKRL